MKGRTRILMSAGEIRERCLDGRHGRLRLLEAASSQAKVLNACEYKPTFLRLYAKSLQAMGFSIPYEDQAGAYERYTGDTSVPGKGEILVWRPHVG